MIDIDSRRRMARARLFFAVMFALSISSFVCSGTWRAIDFAVLLNAAVWSCLWADYTHEIRRLTLHDKDPR